MSFVRYMVIFPAFVLFVVEHEGWVESSVMSLAMTSVLFVGIYLLLQGLRHEYLKRRESDSVGDDASLLNQLGLQE